MERDPVTGTFTGNRGLQIEEKLIFELGEAGRTGTGTGATTKPRL